MAFLSVDKVSKSYESVKALNEVSISFNSGCVFGLLGPNGAGKTSLLRIINRISFPDSGQVLIDGKPLSKVNSQLIGYLPEERGLYPSLSVAEQISYFGLLKGVEKSELSVRVNKWLTRFMIADLAKRKVKELSKGNQQKVQIICSLIHNPSLIVFDEPFSGFDPINYSLLTEVIKELKSEGKSFILSTHNMNSVEEVCDEIILINKGSKILDGTITELKQRFKKNRFRIVLASTPSVMDFSGFNLIPDESLQSAFTVCKTAAVSNNSVFSQIIATGTEILSFSEILPSLSDIFIECVEGHE
jgi:ABC-2 type transport system ATP-binding protein